MGQLENPEGDVNILRQQFRDLRERRSLSQTAIARLLHVSQPTISTFENCPDHMVRKDTLQAIRNLVEMWQRQEGNVAQVNFGGQAMSRKAARVDSRCPHCNEQLPSSFTPLSYCPFCREPLGLACRCGHTVSEQGANFCSWCGRPLAPVGKNPNPYPMLVRDDREAELLRIRLSVSGAIDVEAAVVAREPPSHDAEERHETR